MRSSCTLLSSIALTLVLSATAGAQAQVADHDDQFVVKGCVMLTSDFRPGGTPLFVLSRNVYFESPDTQVRPSDARESGGTHVFVPVFYWIDDDHDVARFFGQRVEVVGKLTDDLDKGEIDIDHNGDFTDLEFEVNGDKVQVRVLRAWLGPAAADEDAEFDVAVRTVDVERVTPLGPCR
jgi:hypothetical protein